MSRNTKKQKPKRRRPVNKATLAEITKNQLVTIHSDPAKGIPAINRGAWLNALSTKQYSKIARAILQFLLYFEEHHYTSYSQEDVKNIDEFMTLVTLCVGDPDFTLTRQEYANLIMVNHFLSAIAAVSSFKTTDALLQAALRLNGNVPRLLFAQNARNEIQIPPKELYNFEPALASIWYNNYMLTISQPTKRTLENQYSHLHSVDERWLPVSHFVSSVYFTSTYFSPDNVRQTKGIFNKALKEAIGKSRIPQITNTPNPNKIAIVTNKWHRNHAVYKSQRPLVEQLKGHYDLTLYHTGNPAQAPDTLMTDLFDRVEYLWFDEATGKPNFPESFVNNDFQLIYFPDIGMSNESVWLSNIRSAPIQAMGYGHPDTSGDNSEIDYFIGGHIEEDATDYYSETMVLIPGLAQEPAWPSYDRKYNYKDDDVVRVNCVWGPDKYNYNLLRLLRMIADNCREAQLEFHLFASPGVNRYASLIPFVKEVAETVPNFILHSQQEYYDYMENAEEHDFSLNSFPFGGYNTIVESLYLGLPVVTLEGERFYNRAAAHLLRQIGMPELIANTPQEFVNISTELVLNKTKLKEYRQALADMDLKAKLFTLEGDYFKQAIDYMIAKHPFNETVKLG